MTDIEIADAAVKQDIVSIAAKLGITEENLQVYGKDKAKVTLDGMNHHGKLILVTAINPTPYGEGKTTVSIGLADAMQALGKKVSLSLRQPSLGPVFGIKGGATGGGYSQIVPMTDINLHFTGDFHAITAANNLISAAIYNHIEQGNELQFATVSFKRCLDVNDRSLRTIEFKCHEKVFQDHFTITAASEVMALFCMAKDLDDLKKRLANIIVGYTKEQTPIQVKDLKLEGALTILLKDAFYPNLVQTLEQTPAFVHGGPFANIAHGCSSIRATNLALSVSDYVITEAGFGSDLGAEKFLNIVCPQADFIPHAVVLVATIRALKHHGEGNLENGLQNLQAHIDHLRQYQVPLIVCINQFSDDKLSEVEQVKNYCLSQQVPVYTSTAYIEGSKGALSLAQAVIDLCEQESNFCPLVSNHLSITEQLEVLAHKLYGAASIHYSQQAQAKLELLKQLKCDHLSICVAKTQYSISDDAKKLGYPKGYTMEVKDIILYRGAGFVTILLGNIMTMPGLPKHPNYEKMDIIDGEINGIF